MTDDQEIARQQRRLAMYRQNVHNALDQAAISGGELLAPLAVRNTLAENRAAIERCKAALRSYGAPVEDAPDDVAAPAAFPAPREVAPQLPQSQQPWLVPYQPNPDFVGRARELADLSKLLISDSPRDAALVPALVGLGGMGKTQLAVEFAYRYAKDFPGGVFWLTMEQADTIEAQIAGFGGSEGLGLFFDESDSDSVRMGTHRSLEQRVKQVRRAWRQSGRYLLICDNLEDPTLLQHCMPPQGRGRLLITTRNTNWHAHSTVRPILLEPLVADEGVALLLEPRARRHGLPVARLLAEPGTRASANALVRTLGALPLALTLAGRYLAESSLSLDEYRARVRVESVRDVSLNSDTLRQELPTGHAASILATFGLSVDRLRPDDPTDQQARALWLAAARLAPEPIPQRLLLRCGDVDLDDRLQREQGDRAIMRLCELGLLEAVRSQSADSYRIHRLLAEYAGLSSEDPPRDRRRAEQALVAELRYLDDHDQIDDAPRRYLEHVLHLVHSLEDRDDLLAAAICHEYALLAYVQDDLTAALQYGKRALDLRRDLLGSHVQTADTLGLIGRILKTRGDLEEARKVIYESKMIYEVDLGLEHIKTAQAIYRLGLIAMLEDCFDQAFGYFLQSYMIKTRVLRPDDVSIAITRIDLAETAQMLGCYKLALRYFREALRILKKHPGKELFLRFQCRTAILFMYSFLICRAFILASIIWFCLQSDTLYVQLIQWLCSGVFFLVCMCSFGMRRVDMVVSGVNKCLMSLFAVVFVRQRIGLSDDVTFFGAWGLVLALVVFGPWIISRPSIRRIRTAAGARVVLLTRAWIYRNARYKPRSALEE